MLNLSVLNFHDCKVLLIFFGKFAEPLSIIAGLLVEQLFRVLGLMFSGIQQLVKLIIERLVFDLRQIELILNPLPGLPNQVLVIEEVPR